MCTYIHVCMCVCMDIATWILLVFFCVFTHFEVMCECYCMQDDTYMYDGEWNRMESHLDLNEYTYVSTQYLMVRRASAIGNGHHKSL